MTKKKGSVFLHFLWSKKINLKNLKFKNLKNKKKGWKYGAGAGLLKRGGSWHFSYLIFSRFIIFAFRNYFTLCKIVLRIWRKIIFSASIILWKKVIHSCLNMHLKISHKPICKGIYKVKIDFWYKATVELVKFPFWYLFKLRAVSWSG